MLLIIFRIFTNIPLISYLKYICNKTRKRNDPINLLIEATTQITSGNIRYEV